MEGQSRNKAHAGYEQTGEAKWKRNGGCVIAFEFVRSCPVAVPQEQSLSLAPKGPPVPQEPVHRLKVSVYTFGWRYLDVAVGTPIYRSSIGHSSGRREHATNYLLNTWKKGTVCNPDAMTLAVDCRCFHDPDGYTSHIGTFYGNMKLLLARSKLKHLLQIMRYIKQHVNAMQKPSTCKDLQGELEILFVCKSGRHRSVGLATLITAVLRDLNCIRGEATVTHLNKPEWQGMHIFCQLCPACCAHNTPSHKDFDAIQDMFDQAKLIYEDA